jgi:hypothetical protein
MTDEEYWMDQFDRAGKMVDRWLAEAAVANIEPDGIVMWMLDAACEMESATNEKAREEIIEMVEEFFRDGPLPKPTKGRTLKSKTRYLSR